MNRVLGFSKGALLGILLSTGAFTFAVTSQAGPAAHAAAAPQIRALPQGGGVRMWGFGFTPNRSERVQLLDKNSHVLATSYLTALPNGQLPFTQVNTAHVGSVTLVASRLHCFRVGIRPLCLYVTDSRIRSYVYSAPHLDEVYGEKASVVVWGSGFTPGVLVQVEVLGAHLQLLDIQAVRADSSNTYLRGTIHGLWLHTGSYSGKVLVVADGAPGESNWVSLNVTP